MKIEKIFFMSFLLTIKYFYPVHDGLKEWPRLQLCHTAIMYLKLKKKEAIYMLSYVYNKSLKMIFD